MKLWSNIFSCLLTKSLKHDSTKRESSTLSIYLRFFHDASVLDWINISLAGVFIIIGALCPPYFFYLYGTIINEFISNEKDKQRDGAIESAIDIFTSNINKVSTEIFVLGVLNFISLNLAGLLWSYTSSRQIFKMRMKIFETILNHDMTWYDLNQTGDFATLLSENFVKIEDGIGEKLVFFLFDQAVFIACCIWSLVLGWNLTLICLITLPLLLIIVSVISRLSRELSKGASDSYARSGAVAEEVFRTIRTVVAFGGGKKEIERYEQTLHNAKKYTIRICVSNGLKNGMLWFVRFSGTALPWWYAFKIILEADSSTGSILYTPATIIIICMNISVGSFYFTIGCVYLEVFGVACGAAEKIFEILDYKDEVKKISEGLKLKQLTGSIIFDNVFFKYPSRKDVEVLKGLTVQIEPGETVAFVGQSGCGKSTCIQLLERFYDPCAGKIYIDGVDIRNLDISWLRSTIGLVNQEATLFANTIAENIRFGKLTATQAEVEKAAKKAQIHSFITSLPKGYETQIGERGMQLSGGQKQRIAIARALIRNPSILLLDEATSALDLKSESQVQFALQSVTGQCTTIIVAHRLSTVKNADKIFVLCGGKVVEQGTYSELMDMKGHFYKLEKTQEHQTMITTTSVQEAYNEFSRSSSDCRQKEWEQNELSIHENVISIRNNKHIVIEMIQMSRPEWKWIVFGILASLGVGVGPCFYSIICENIIWCFSIKDEEVLKQSVKLNCISMLLLGVGVGLSFISQAYAFGTAGENLVIRIRRRMFTTVLEQDMEWFDRKENGVGALCSRISSDGNDIQSATGLATGIITSFTATVVFCYGFALYYQWKISLVLTSYFLFLMITIVLQQKITKSSVTLKEKQLLKSNKVNKFAMEAVNNIRTVAAFDCQNFFLRRYTEELIPYMSISRRISSTSTVVLGISSCFNFFNFATGSLYGGKLTSNNVVNYGVVMKVSALMYNASWAVGNLFSFIPNLQRGIRAAGSIQKLFRIQPKINTSHDDLNEKNWEDGRVEYRKVFFSYPTRSTTAILKDLNLSIHPGQTVALVGSTGCGKSSIIQLLERLYDPTSGEISVDNSNIKYVNIQQHRANFGIVSQEPNLFDRTIAENIAYGDNQRTVTMQEIVEVAKITNIHEFVCSLPQGYETRLGTAGTQISGGQKQRIAIARALIRNPRILILDEATSALDNESECIVQQALDKAKEGRTCITIAHRLTTIQNADLIYVIDEGKVVEKGTHQELINLCGLYYKFNRS